jgi:3-oxoacyl-[acyl-carrier protein] reductase
MAGYVEYGLDGRGAIVTGAGTGIGAACAIELAKAGAKVALLGRRMRPLEETLAECEKYSPGGFVFSLDVADEPAVKDAVKQAADKFGSVDVLINNAGVDSDYKPGENPFDQYFDMTPDEYISFFRVHVYGHYTTARACALYMIPAKYGRIVNITSVTGLTGSYSSPAYTSSKAAAILQTKALARKYGKHNITVNSVAPGMVNTPMKRNSPPDEFAFVAGLTPLGRVAEPIDIARVAMFFAQENLFVTGSNIVVDGGSNM